MTTISARVLLKAVAELDEAGDVLVLIRAGGFSLGEARIEPGEWPVNDPVPQGRLLCQRLPCLRGFASTELVESTRVLVARAFSGERSITGGPHEHDVEAETSPLTLLGGTPVEARTSRVFVSAIAQELLARADLVRAALRLAGDSEASDVETALGEMVAIRLVEADRCTLTPLGLKVAARLQSESEFSLEDLARGISFASYVPGDGALAGTPEAGVTDDGEALYGDERVVAKGKAPGDKEPQPAAGLARRWEEAGAAAQREVVPVAFSSASATGRIVWFSDRAGVEASAFDHVTRGRNDLTYTTEVGRRSGTAAVNVYHCGERVAVIAGRYGVAPELVRTFTRRVGRGCMVHTPVALQRTLLFGDDLVLVLEVAGPRARVHNPAASRRLMTAACYDDLQGLREALEAGAQIEARDTELSTALINAAAWGRARAAEYLLRHGADARARNGRRRTALMAAASEGYGEIVCLIASHLVARGMREELNARDGAGNTAMHWAAREGKRTIISYLRLFGANATAVNNAGRTPEQEATFFGRPSAAGACRASKLVMPKNATAAATRLITRAKECGASGRHAEPATPPRLRKAG